MNASDEGPTDLRSRSWLGVLKRTVTEFRDDNLTDWAAALTYYAVLAIFPALIVLVSVLGLIGESATQPLIDNLGKVAPGPAQDIFTSAIENIQGSQGAAGVFFVIGLLAAIWSASGYIAAFMRASNAIYDIEEGRPIWKTLPVRVGLTVLLMVLTAVSAIGVTLSGGLAREVGDLIGVGDTAVQVWNIVKWPVLLLVVSLMFAVLYWAAPNVKQPGFRWITPGGVLAVLGLGDRVGRRSPSTSANFGSYNKTYGALAGPIVFLVWLWISNVMILLGAEFNAELERGRAIEDGHAPARQGAVRRAARHAQAGEQPVVSVETAADTPDGAFSGYAEPGQRPPFGSYAALTALFNGALAAGLIGTRRSGRELPERVETRDIVLTGVATHKLSRLIAKDKITAFARAPFTEFQEPGGPAEVEERARGDGLAAHDRRAADLPLLPRDVDLGRLQPRPGRRPARDPLRGIGADRAHDLRLPPDRLQGRRGARPRRQLSATPARTARSRCPRRPAAGCGTRTRAGRAPPPPRP